MDYFLGIDVGTTGTKTLLLNENGEVCESAYESYGLQTKDGFIEQDLMDWYQAVVHTVRACTAPLTSKDMVAALSLSTQAGALVVCDKYGNPIYPAISWMDKRPGTDKALMESFLTNEEMYKITGLRVTNGLPLLQIMWLKKHRPDIFQNAQKYLTTAEFINFKLTGRMCGDPSNLAYTQLFDIHQREFSPYLMELAGITRSMLPDIISSGEVIGSLMPDTAKEMGLNGNVPVISGGHDQYCGALGSNSIHSGDMMLSTGTAWVALSVMDTPPPHYIKGVSLGRHLFGDKWGLLSALSTGGVSMEWFKNKLGVKDTLEDFDLINLEASQKLIGAGGIFFFPFFNGSYYPEYNANNRAAFLGLTLSHDRYDLARAIMEGVAFELRRMIEGISHNSFSINRICLTGGAAKSDLWIKIISNIIGKEIFVLNNHDAPCIGAALLAMKGAGYLHHLSEGSSSIVTGQKILPDPAAAQTYDHLYGLYCDKYAKLCRFYES